MAEANEPTKPKPAPKTRYGPTFDEIERRDPWQFYNAHRAWALEKMVQSEMLKVYRERMEVCFQREQENFPIKCRSDIIRYWKFFNHWKKTCTPLTEEGRVSRFRVPVEEYYREVEELYAERDRAQKEQADS